MLNTPVLFITVPYSELKNKVVIEPEMEIGINILIDVIEVDMTILEKFTSKFRNHFMYSLSDKVINDSRNLFTLLPRLYTLFTLSDSLVINKGVIPVISAKGDKLFQGLEMIKDFFLLQGEKVELIIFQLGDQIKNNIWLSNIEQLRLFDADSLKAYTNQEIVSIILYIQDTSSLSTEISDLKGLIQKNKYYGLFVERTTLKRDNNWYRHQAYLWQERAGLYLSFISISKQVGESEYYDIKKWYHDEYEVLPLWYKRFGHLIKVFKGKRSFKSLFKNY